jgi:hypothetical protein
MGILDFDKPKKVRSTKEHNEMHQSDSGVAGTYVPNMSEEDNNKWKGKHVKGADERIEIRKNLDSQLLVIVYKKTDAYENEWDHDMRISMNGPCRLTFKEWEEFKQAVEEAREKLKFEDVKEYLNFDKEWLINKFYEISEYEGNGETIEDVEFKKNGDGVKITFSLNCGRYGTHKNNYIRISREDGVYLSLDEILEGGGVEAELEEAIIEKINEQF